MKIVRQPEKRWGLWASRDDAWDFQEKLRKDYPDIAVPRDDPWWRLGPNKGLEVCKSVTQ